MRAIRLIAAFLFGVASTQLVTGVAENTINVWAALALVVVMWVWPVLLVVQLEIDAS